jgi:hypothetical protein
MINDQEADTEARVLSAVITAVNSTNDGHGAGGAHAPKVNGTGSGHSAAKDHDSLPLASQMLFSLIIMLMIGQVLKQISHKLKLPFTVLCCVFGFLVGCIPYV